ncbi:MAG: hypothetical protein FH749_04900 [Firmicutes bacterium]|nr:hypothetical protein [Bacillota bacterium]
MNKYLERIVDALDIETFVICRDEDEGMDIIRKMMGEMGLKDVDIVFCQHRGPGARIRARGYIFRSGDHYGWLKEAE